jgi:hypothetical protein
MDELDEIIKQINDEFGEGTATTADNINRPEPKQSVKEIELFNEFNIRNPKAGGGMLVEPGFGGTRQGYKKPIDKGGRPIAKTGVSAYIREVLGKLPKEGRFDAEALAKDIIQKFPDSSKSFIDKRDGSVSTSTIFKVIQRDKSLAPLKLKPYSQSEKTIIRVQNFIDNFIKENDRNPSVGEVKIGAKTDPTQLTKYKKQGLIKGMQDTIFDAHEIAIDYLNKNEKPSIKELEKLVGGAQRVKNAKTLLSNMYLRTLEAMRNRAAGINQPSSVYKNFSIEELDSLKRKIRSVPGYKDIYSRQIEDLVSEAYKDQPKKLKTALKKIGRFKKLNQDLQKLGINLQLDHPLSYDFVKKAKGGADPEELIKVKPIPDRVNLFKSNLDNKLIEISDTLKKQPANKNALNLYQDIQSVAGDLQIDVGKISKAGNIISAQAARIGDTPLLPEVRKGAERQNAFREFVKNISNDPRIQRLGINLKELKNLAKLPKVDVAKYDAAVNKFIQKSGKFGLPFAAGYLGIRELSTPAQAADGAEATGFTTGEKIAGGAAAAGTLGTKTGRDILGTAFKTLGKGADRFLFRPLTAIEAPTLAIPQSAYAAGKLASDAAKGQETDTSALDITLPTALSSLAANKKFGLDLFADNAGKVKKFLRGPFTQSGVRALSTGSLFATPFIETAIQGYNARQALLKAREKYGTDDMVPTAVGMAPREYVRDLAIENQKFEGEGLTPFSAAGGGIAKLAGIDDGPPPTRGPNPQGLSYLMKRAMKIKE